MRVWKIKVMILTVMEVQIKVSLSEWAENCSFLIISTDVFLLSMFPLFQSLLIFNILILTLFETLFTQQLFHWCVFTGVGERNKLTPIICRA